MALVVEVVMNKHNSYIQHWTTTCQIVPSIYQVRGMLTYSKAVRLLYVYQVCVPVRIVVNCLDDKWKVVDRLGRVFARGSR